MKNGASTALIFLLTASSVLFYPLAGYAINGSGTGTGTGTATSNARNNTQATPKSTKDMASVKAYVDKNKDGQISQDEITKSIEEFFDGNSPYGLQDIQSVVDSFFD